MLSPPLPPSKFQTGQEFFAEEFLCLFPDPWFPRHASELDNCNHLMTKYEPELDMNHPGFSDKEYRARRKMIAEIAFAYKFGHPIPHIEYVQTEIDTWNAVFGHVCELSKQHACKEYIEVFEMLKQEGIFTMGAVPQLQDMSNFLKSKFFVRYA